MDVRQDIETNEDELSGFEPAAKRFRGQFEQHQATNENNEPIELTNTTCTNLQHLIEDCLLKIFEVKSLTPLDLCSLAETCTSFQRIVQRVFPKDLKIEIWRDGLYKVESRKYSDAEGRTSQDIKRILKHFGLLELSIVGNYNEESSNFVLELVAEHCVDTLVHLEMVRLDIPAVVTAKLKSIFKRLQILKLRKVNIGADKTLFADLDSLIELRVIRVGNAILNNIFLKLKRFTYSGYEKVRVDHPLLTFISRHRTLKILELDIPRLGDALKTNFLQVIAQNYEALEELSLWLGRTMTSSLQPLQTLQSLKTLSVWSVECDDWKFFASLTNLRELRLDRCILPTVSSQFAALAQLTKLHIREIYRAGPVDAVGIIRLLINLEEFTVTKGRFVLDEETFSKVVDVVKRRPQVLTVKCNFDFVPMSCDENRNVNLIRIGSSARIDRNKF